MARLMPRIEAVFGPPSLLTRVFIPVLFGLILAGCIRGKVTVVSPSELMPKVTTNSITIEIQDDDATDVAVTNEEIQFGINAVKNGSSWFAFGVPLKVGENRLTITGKGPGGKSLRTRMTVTSNPTTIPFVRAIGSPRVSESLPFETTLFLDLPENLRGEMLLIDWDGDGVIDERQPYAARLKATYKEHGYYSPLITVRTRENLLLTNRWHDPIVLTGPGSGETTTLHSDLGSDLVGVRRSVSGDLWVLSRGEARLSRLDKDEPIISSVKLLESPKPEAFVLDGVGSVYLVDSENNSVMRFALPPGGDPVKPLRPVLRFGGEGGSSGQLRNPSSIVLAADDSKRWVIIADTGNQRLQWFTVQGTFHLERSQLLKCSHPLRSPSTLVSLSQGGVAVGDRESGIVHLMTPTGTCDRHLGHPDGTPKKMVGLAGIEELASGDLLVAVPGSHAVHFFSSHGFLFRTVAVKNQEPRWASSVFSGPGHTLLLLTANSMVGVGIAEDPPGKDPASVVGEYVRLVAEGKYDLATRFLDHRNRDRLTQELDAPEIRESLSRQAQRVSKIESIRYGPFMASVRIHLENPPQVESFQLSRDSHYRWVIVDAQPEEN